MTLPTASRAVVKGSRTGALRSTKGRLNNKYLALSVTLSTCGWEGAAR
jgi:hypothetical protein